MRWFCVQPSLLQQTEPRIRGAPYYCINERSRITEGRAGAPFVSILQVRGSTVDAYQDAATMAALPDDTSTVIPRVLTDYPSCCGVTDLAAMSYDGHQEMTRFLGLVESFNLPISKADMPTKLLYPGLKDMWIETENLTVVCMGLNVEKCANSHTISRLSGTSPEATHIALGEHLSKEAQGLILLDRRGAVVATTQGGNRLWILCRSANEAWNMWQTDAFRAYRKAPDEYPIRTKRIENEIFFVSNQSVAENGNGDICENFAISKFFDNTSILNYLAKDRVVEKFDQLRDEPCHDVLLEKYADGSALTYNFYGAANGIKLNVEVDTKLINDEHSWDNRHNQLLLKAALDEGKADNIDCEFNLMDEDDELITKKDKIHFCVRATDISHLKSNDECADAEEKIDVLISRDLVSNCFGAKFVCVQKEDLESNADFPGLSLANNKVIEQNFQMEIYQCHDVPLEEYADENASSYNDHPCAANDGKIDVEVDTEPIDDYQLWDKRHNALVLKAAPSEGEFFINDCGLHSVDLNDVLSSKEDAIHTCECATGTSKGEQCVDAEEDAHNFNREGPINSRGGALSVRIGEQEPDSKADPAGRSCGAISCADIKAKSALEKEAGDIAVLGCLDDAFDPVDELIVNTLVEKSEKSVISCELASCIESENSDACIDICESIHAFAAHVNPSVNVADRADLPLQEVGIVEYCMRKQAFSSANDRLSHALFNAGQDDADLVFEVLLSDDPHSDEWIHDVASKNILKYTPTESSEAVLQICASTESEDTYTLIMNNDTPEAILESSLQDDQDANYDLITSFRYPLPRSRHGNNDFMNYRPSSPLRQFQSSSANDDSECSVKVCAPSPQSVVSMALSAVSSGLAQQKALGSHFSKAKSGSALTRPRSFVHTSATSRPTLTKATSSLLTRPASALSRVSSSLRSESSPLQQSNLMSTRRVQS